MERHDIKNEASVGIAISTFLGTVTLFFAGILISRFEIFDISLRIPILYLIVSTFGFIFSSVIYANMTGSLRLSHNKDEHYIKIGNSLSEYLGLYPFIASVPMVVSAITDDIFLKYSILAVTLLGIFLYSISPFSLLGRGLKDIKSWYLVTLVITASPLVGFLYQHSSSTVFNVNGIVFLGFMAALAVFQAHKT